MGGDGLKDIPRRTLDRRRFIRNATITAWATPTIISVLAGPASAQAGSDECQDTAACAAATPPACNATCGPAINRNCLCHCKAPPGNPDRCQCSVESETCSP